MLRRVICIATEEAFIEADAKFAADNDYAYNLDTVLRIEAADVKPENSYSEDVAELISGHSLVDAKFGLLYLLDLDGVLHDGLADKVQELTESATEYIVEVYVHEYK